MTAYQIVDGNTPENISFEFGDTSISNNNFIGNRFQGYFYIRVDEDIIPNEECPLAILKLATDYQVKVINGRFQWTIWF